MTNEEYINQHPEQFKDDIDKWLFTEFSIIGGCCSAEKSHEYHIARMVAEKLNDAVIDKACEFIKDHHHEFSFWNTEEYELELVPYPSNHQVQDILDEMGMIDENGYCPHTVEEIFRAGIEWLAKQGVSYQTTILENYDGLLITDMEVPSDKFNKGNKVIVQIRKHD